MNKQTIGSFFYNIALLLDIVGNVLIVGVIKFFVAMPPASGNAHFTMSEALDELRNAGSKPACKVCQILSIMFNPFNIRKNKLYDHCASSMVGMPQDIKAG